MRTISPEEFKKKYGSQAFTQFSAPVEKNAFAERTKTAFQEGVSKTKQGFTEAGMSTNPLTFLEGTIKGTAGAVETAFSPITAAAEPIIKPTIGKAIEYTANKISDIPAVQRFATSKAGEITSRATEDINNFNTIAAAVAGIKGTPKVGSAVARGAEVAGTKIAETTGEISSKAMNLAKTGVETIKPLMGDLVPSRTQIVNSAISKALRMTPGDEATIAELTGKGVGEFLAENNLIRPNINLTQEAVNNFFKQNYALVREEIGKVKTVYNATEVPRYQEALQIIRQQVNEIPGLEQSMSKVKTLLRKKSINLKDVQDVKELLDKHFSLYSKTGNVKEGIIKEGLANIRKELKQFVENEVKNNTGANIGDLNNKVMSARSISDAIKLRSTKGLTKSAITLSDIGLFGGAGMIGGPITGLAAVFLNKLRESPSILLRVAKYLDDLSDVQKLKIQTELQQGKIPSEFNQFIKSKK